MSVSTTRPLFGAPRLRHLRTVVVALACTVALATPDAYAQKGPKKPQSFNVLPFTVTGVTVQDGQLVANVLVGTTSHQIPLTLTPRPTSDPSVTCPILDLALGPIHLDLLGLNVDTSAICLTITAQHGGGLLGDLLCAIANLLNGGLDLGSILASLSPDQLQTLTGGLTQVLNAVFTPLTSSDAVTNASCDILKLSLGPLDLTLLGLNVQLDNCEGGPVTLDITADPGGGLLGDLLCDLGDLLNSPGTPNRQAILALLQDVVRLIGRLL